MLVFVVKAMHTGRSVWTSAVTDLSSFSAQGVNISPTKNNAAYAPSMASTANTSHPMMAPHPQYQPHPHPQQYQQAPYRQGVAYV